VIRLGWWNDERGKRYKIIIKKEGKKNNTIRYDLEKSPKVEIITFFGTIVVCTMGGDV
jgi:hypothetical protein